MSNEREQSEFNMAVSYLNRLNSIFYTLDEASASSDLYKWFQGLTVLYRELSTYIKPNEVEEYEAEIDRLAKITVKYNKLIVKDMSWDDVKALHRFELKLRKVCADSGLQNKMKDSALDSLR